MAPMPITAKEERERKLKSILGESCKRLLAQTQTLTFAAFASILAARFEIAPDASLINELQAQIRGLPLQASSAVTAKQGELDKLGTELWNLSTRIRRDEGDPNSESKEATLRKNRSLCILRAFSFLLLDSAGGQGLKGRQRRSVIRLMKVALKAAKMCIDGSELSTATKILERAAEYQEILSKAVEGETEEETALADRLRAEYFAVRTTLVSANSLYSVHSH